MLQAREQVFDKVKFKIFNFEDFTSLVFIYITVIDLSEPCVLKMERIEQTSNEQTRSANAQIYLKLSLMYHDDERIRPDANKAN